MITSCYIVHDIAIRPIHRRASSAEASVGRKCDCAVQTQSERDLSRAAVSEQLELPGENPFVISCDLPKDSERSATAS